MNYPTPKSKIYSVGFLPNQLLSIANNSEAYIEAIGFTPRSEGHNLVLILSPAFVHLSISALQEEQ